MNYPNDNGLQKLSSLQPLPDQPVPLFRPSTAPEYVLDSLPQSFSDIDELTEYIDELECEIDSVEGQIEMLVAMVNNQCDYLKLSGEWHDINEQIDAAYKARRWKRTQISALRVTKKRWVRGPGDRLIKIEDDLANVCESLAAIKRLTLKPSSNNNAGIVQLKNRVENLEKRAAAEKEKRVNLDLRLASLRAFVLRAVLAFASKNTPEIKRVLECLDFVEAKTQKDPDWGTEKP